MALQGFIVGAGGMQRGASWQCCGPWVMARAHPRPGARAAHPLWCPCMRLALSTTLHAAAQAVHSPPLPPPPVLRSRAPPQRQRLHGAHVGREGWVARVWQRRGVPAPDQVGGSAGRDDGGLEPRRSHAGQRRVRRRGAALGERRCVRTLLRGAGGRRDGSARVGGGPPPCVWWQASNRCGKPIAGGWGRVAMRP